MCAERSPTAHNDSERVHTDLRKSHFRRSAHYGVLGSHYGLFQLHSTDLNGAEPQVNGPERACMTAAAHVRT
jgi:hypothetical protein